MSPSSIWPESDEVTETTEIFLIFFQSLICCCVFSSLKAERIMRLNTSSEIIPWEKTLTVFQRRPTDVCFCNCGAAIRMYVAFFCFCFLSLIYFLTLCLQEFLEYEPAVHVSLMVKAASQSCSRLGFIKDLRNEVYAAPVQFMTRLLLYMMTACLWMF